MNLLYNRLLICVTILLLTANFVFCQDIHLSHIHASPTILNPAMNGLFNGQARVMANTKSQWNTVTRGYKTAVASADMKMIILSNGDFISGGVQLLADKAGDLDFSTTSAAFSFSYLKSFDKRGRNFFSFGVQNAYVNNQVDYSKIITFDYIPALDGEISNHLNYWDFNAGIGWFNKMDKYNSYYFGLSAFHLNKPQVGFKNTSSSENATTLYRRINLHGGATIRVSHELTLKPNFLFMDQGPHQEINLGSFIRYRTYRKGLHKRPLYYIYAGVWLRSYFESNAVGVDAVIASIKYEYRKLTIALSYDVNISTYSLASGGRGGLEFSLVRIFDWERPVKTSRKIKCPAM